MNIAVGTKNKIKLQAVEEALQDYPQLANAIVHSFEVPSGINEQPFSLEEIIKGAKNRSKSAYEACEDCSFGFGIESGLFEAPGTQTGYLEACICCIYDGANHSIGLSCGFEIPPHILEFVLDKNLCLGDACYASGITTNKKLGNAEGLIGILSKGRIDRKGYTKQCIVTALLQVENIDLYAKKKSIECCDLGCTS